MTRYAGYRSLATEPNIEGTRESPTKGVVHIGTLLLVGRGWPDSGGIPAFLEMLASCDAASARDVRFLNLAHASRAGGRLSAVNVGRTVRDLRHVWAEGAGRDICHLHSTLSPGVTLLRAGLLAATARARGCRVVIHAHGGRLPFWLTTRRRRLLARVLLAPAARVVAVSEGGWATLAGVLRQDRVCLIPNGVPVNAFGPPEGAHDPPRVLYAGVLTPRKGVLDLLEASAMLSAQGVAHELWLAGGNPPEGSDAAAQIQDAAGPEVRLLGDIPHEQMAALYRRVDLVCLPSWWEAAPLSVLEAMASSLAVVATDVGDVGRMVVDGVTGILVPPRAPVDLAAALGTLLTDAPRREVLGVAGRARVEGSFSMAATSAAIGTLYDEVEGARA